MWEGGEVNRQKTNLIVTEGIEGCWHYHFSYPGTFTKALCGRVVMVTSLPVSSWGKVSHLRERYCQECATRKTEEEG